MAEAPLSFVPDQYGLIQLGDMRLGLVEITRLHARRTNPRRMSDEEYAALQKSVERFGFKTFILVEEDAPGSFGVVDGHHRWRLAQETGMARVPVVVIDGDKNFIDLAMLTFNVSGEPIEGVFVDMLAELTRTLGAETVGAYTAINAEFLDDLTRTAAQGLELLDQQAASLAGEDAKKMDGAWQSRGFVIEFPRTPEAESLLEKVMAITGQEVVGQAVFLALSAFVTNSENKDPAEDE